MPYLICLNLCYINQSASTELSNRGAQRPSTVPDPMTANVPEPVEGPMKRRRAKLSRGRAEFCRRPLISPEILIHLYTDRIQVVFSALTNKLFRLRLNRHLLSICQSRNSSTTLDLFSKNIA